MDTASYSLGENTSQSAARRARAAGGGGVAAGVKVSTDSSAAVALIRPRRLGSASSELSHQRGPVPEYQIVDDCCKKQSFEVSQGPFHMHPGCM